ncbi:hypothetical protein [Mucilaginibacter pineti]|nr:hypothetical protein [Mucilaginibacter pineti]
MSLAEYAHLKDPDSLCYWLEYGTKDLGEIGGSLALNKFELWQMQEDKEFKDGRFEKEHGYAWNKNRGKGLSVAFLEVRRLAVQIVENSIEGNWQAIDDIPFHAIGKWKLAFLFSNKKLFPVYSRPALLSISNGLMIANEIKTPISVIQKSILQLKPVDEDVIGYGTRLYFQYAERPPKPNYYIIGSKYEDDKGNDTVSVMKKFIDNQCIAMGWNWGNDFSNLMSQNNDKVNYWVASHYKGKALGKVQGYFRLFANLKPGDIIAVKSYGNFGKLEIIGYAQVVARNGKVYFHDNNLLGHHIHVEFLDADFVKKFNHNYAATIHQLTEKKDKKAFYDIFNWYVEVGDIKEKKAPPINETSSDESEEGQSGYNIKKEGSFQRGAIGSATVNLIHSRIQNRFMQYLEINYPGDHKNGEKRNIDAIRITESKYIIYEIKPHAGVIQCIRDGIGQLLHYMHKEQTKKKKCIVIVGPNEPEPLDLNFIAELRTTFNVPFGYLAFNERNLTATEF